jgi:hypothetical protein
MHAHEKAIFGGIIELLAGKDVAAVGNQEAGDSMDNSDGVLAAQ